MEKNPLIFKEKFIKSFDGTRIYYSVYGKGKNYLVLTDGIACDLFIWKYIRNYFHPFIKIVQWNYRGHGKSATPEDDSNLTIPDLVRDLKGVIDDLGAEKVILMGHSMGVQVILEFFGTYPDRVLSLIPTCGSYQYPLDTFHNSKILKYLLPIIRESLEKFETPIQFAWSKFINTDFAYYLGYMLELNRVRAKKEDIMPYLEHLSVLRLKTFTKMLYYASLHSARYVLEKIDVPTLIFAATKDSFTPYYLSEIMHQMIKGSQIVKLPGGSHAAPLEFPELVNLALEKFLIEHQFIEMRKRGNS